MALNSKVSLGLETGSPESPKYLHQHPIYWFDDGSLTFGVQHYVFRVHLTLFSRQSPLFASLTTKFHSREAVFLEAEACSGTLGCDYLPIQAEETIDVADLEVLLQHVYHDFPLTQSPSFDRVSSILRISSPKQLDFPHIYTMARSAFEEIYPSDPLTLNPHTHSLYDGLTIATRHSFPLIRKAILYALVTTHHFEEDEHDAPPEYETESPPMQTPRGSTLNEPESNMPREDGSDPMAIERPNCDNPESSRRYLSGLDLPLCKGLLNRIIEYFTPILYTPATASHMVCTDIFADMWMPYVIQPSLEDDGVYKPLETLERIKNIDWGKDGLCSSCIVEKRREWTEEQENVWNLMDNWLAAETATNVLCESQMRSNGV